MIGMAFLAAILLVCLGTIPWTLGTAPAALNQQSAAEGTIGTARYNDGDPRQGRLPPWWWEPDPLEARRLNALVSPATQSQIATRHGYERIDDLVQQTEGPGAAELRRHWPTRQAPVTFAMGTDMLGRSLLVRVLAGGGISLGIGLAAAFISVMIGTVYGSLAAYAGGKTDAVMMRIVDILYGLPYILLVVLLAVASDAALDEYITRSQARGRWMQEQAVQVSIERGVVTGNGRAARASGDRLLGEDAGLRAQLEDQALKHPRLQPRVISEGQRHGFNVVVLLIAIGGVSWLTMARVVRGQVLSLKAQPFMEAARAMGVPWRGQFVRHLLPNLMGPIIVYATLTVPQAILQESFLSFLGIGVKPPLPSWGNLAAEGLKELNTYKSNWWLLVFPCLMLGTTLLALNFVGEGLREAFDPKRARR
jgi:oligopeptide transport system permease protein